MACPATEMSDAARIAFLLSAALWRPGGVSQCVGKQAGGLY
jgi:hypothetical protein